MGGRWALDHSTHDYVIGMLGREPNCSMLSRMHHFEQDMDRWLKKLDEKESIY